MTLSAWINSSSFPVDDAAVVSKRGGPTRLPARHDEDTGTAHDRLQAHQRRGATMFRYGATTLQPNTWYYVTGVYNAAAQTMDVYLNGALDNGYSRERSRRRSRIQH